MRSTTEQFLLSVMLFTFGMLLGSYISNTRTENHCKSHGFTHVKGTAIKCEVVKEST